MSAFHDPTQDKYRFFHNLHYPNKAQRVTLFREESRFRYITAFCRLILSENHIQSLTIPDNVWPAFEERIGLRFASFFEVLNHLYGKTEAEELHTLRLLEDRTLRCFHGLRIRTADSGRADESWNWVYSLEVSNPDFTSHSIDLSGGFPLTLYKDNPPAAIVMTLLHLADIETVLSRTKGQGKPNRYFTPVLPSPYILPIFDAVFGSIVSRYEAAETDGIAPEDVTRDTLAAYKEKEL